MPIPYEELVSFCAACLTAAGSAPDAARLCAEVVVAADLRGITSHGVNRLKLYCDALRNGRVDGHATPQVVTDNISSALVDGRNAQGAVVGKFCMDLCIEKAKRTGIAIVAGHNSNHFGIAGYYGFLAAEQGLIGMAFTNTSPVVVPTRSRQPALGTNPISFIAPVHDQPPFALDMATPTVALGKVEVKYREQQPCPAGWGVDGSGATTTNPESIIFGGGLSPLGGSENSGGYKGYGLALMVEMLCGVLAGAHFGLEVPPTLNPTAFGNTSLVNLGQSFIAIDPEKILPGFPVRAAALAAQMRGLPQAEDACGPVLMPGDKEHEMAERQKRDGIDLSRALCLELVEVGLLYQVEIPAALQP
eukprot:TRINITY_DN14791_c0_g1_i1.p1 TRINITY_DN14791_c0_g1~~TRINITY_DN14791_c0_g1_i1.p1  ORF type:complete len:369 (-),score=44.07 TRINITY_DN14791_c0_g1_i1:9-1091(-)